MHRYRVLRTILFLLALSISGRLPAQVAVVPYTTRPIVTNALAVKHSQTAAYRRLKEPRPEGRVVLRGLLDRRGSLVQTSFVSNADPVLDEIARTTFIQMRFTPALNGTDSVQAWVEIPFAFGPDLLREATQSADRDLVLRGGMMFDALRDNAVPNPGILIRAGKIMQLGGTIDTAAAQVVQLAADEFILPGFFDLHAHYAVDFFSGGRIDETTVYPTLFLANGVTSTFPAGEMQPDKMRALRLRIENGEQPGPRLYNSGPYYGTARPGWTQTISADSIYREVDYWAAQGARGFKAKGIRPEHLKPLIERAHRHGLTVTGHLDSGARNSVNPRDAILMGIDRIEHFIGGDAFSNDKSAYASFEVMKFDTPEFVQIARLYVRHRVNYDATRSAYGYYGRREPQVYEYWTDEKRFLTPYMRGLVESRQRTVNEQFERIYRVKKDEIKALYDAGGGHLITVGTDHPSWGEFFSGFSIHRELHAISLTGIPAHAVLKMATINSARALGVSDRLGTIEIGKFADLVVIGGDPFIEIRNTRNTRHVIRAGVLYDPAVLLKSVEGKLGPQTEAEAAAWGRRSN
ncbi:MAG: amidohydrolase family protein [Gemmatimonadota bacterium]